MNRARIRTLFSYGVGFGPALLFVALAFRSSKDTLGLKVALPLILLLGVGIALFCALFLAYFPALVERIGLRRLSAFLRTFWDEDAR